MTYRHRRLRPDRAPGYLIVSDGPLHPEAARRVKEAWRAAGRRREPLVIDGTRFRVEVVTR
jgi:hypothetical protein